MSNVNRQRWGMGAPIPMPVASATVIEIGDFVCLVSALLVPAASVADAGDAAANRKAVSNVFAGIAVSASRNGDTDDVLVVQEGIVMLNQKTAAAINVGTPVEIYADASAAESQTIVAGTANPIAVCVKTHDNTVTATICKLQENLIFGGSNA